MSKGREFKHIKVPGFGCTYPTDFTSDSNTTTFTTLRLVDSETYKLATSLPTFVFVIEAGRGEIKLDGRSYGAIDFERVQFVPRGARLEIIPTTPIIKFLVLGFKDLAVERCVKQFDLDNESLKSLLKETGSVPRTTWVNEACHRYMFERSITEAQDSLATQFLESEIIKEYFYANQRDESSGGVPFFLDLPDSLRSVLEYIERNLSEDITLPKLCKAGKTSKPTLVRLFRAHLNTSPVKYLWSRRLEEAERLLLTGRFTVAQASNIAGFSDPSAFSSAYKAHFGKRPSER